MLLVYRYVFLHEMPLNRMILITLLVYFLTSKVVNEQYLLAVVPFSLIELHGVSGRRPAWHGWRPFHALLWVAPLVFAAFNVPLDRFLLPLYATLFGPRANQLLKDGVSGLQDQLQIIPWYHHTIEPYYLLTIAYCFVALVTISLIVLARRPTSLRLALASLPLGRFTIDLALEVALASTSFASAARSVISGGRTARRRRTVRRAAVPLAADDADRPSGALAPVPGMAMDLPHRAPSSFPTLSVAQRRVDETSPEVALRRAPPFPEHHPQPPERVVR
jgi:hypothetical protein